MSQQDAVMLQGYVGLEPQMFTVGQQVTGCSLRLGCTRRYYHPEERIWKNSPTTWVTVKAFRELAEHIGRSVHKGDPIMVQGHLSMESWKTEEANRQQVVLEASALGHNLAYGISDFTKTAYGKSSDQDDEKEMTDEEVRQELTQGSYEQCDEFAQAVM